MTREEILTKKPGQELDEFVGKTFGFAPKIKWYAMNKDETAFYMDFDSKSFAENWHNTNITRFPDGIYRTDGGHIVCREIYKKFSEDISAAWEIANIKCPSPFSLMKCTNGEWVVNWCNKNYECCNCDEECQSKYEIEAPTAPEAICKAALLAVIENAE